MTLSLASSQLIAIAVAGLVLIGMFTWLRVQKGRAARADLKEDAGQRLNLAAEKREFKSNEQAISPHGETGSELPKIRDFQSVERERFLKRWTSALSRFVDAPKEAVMEADGLASSLIRRPGYPASDFEDRLANISINHPQATENYRVAHAIALRAGDSETSTEDLRTAMTHYKLLFEELLQAPVVDKHFAA